MGTRRGNSEGTIRKRADGRWEARLLLADGTRKSLYGKTRQEAARLLSSAMRDCELGLTASNSRETVEQFLTSWIEAYRHQVRLSSYTRYKHVVRLHLVPGLGTIVLSKLTPQQSGCTTRMNWGAGRRHRPSAIVTSCCRPRSRMRCDSVWCSAMSRRSWTHRVGCAARWRSSAKSRRE